MDNVKFFHTQDDGYRTMVSYIIISMMTRRSCFITFLGSIWALLALLLSLGYGHMLMAASAMPNMKSDKATISQCQSSCGSSATTPVATIPQAVSPQVKEPVPSEPYFLAFMGVGWLLVLSFGFYLLWHLRWKPPDLTLLYAVYRI